MITVLWVMTVASVMATVAALAGRNAVNATRNRTQLERAFWIATGCAAHAQAAIDDTLLAATTFEEAADTWRVLDRAVLPLPSDDAARCSITLEAAGTRLDVNGVPDEMIGNLLRALGYSDDSATRLVDALADWKDSDDVARPNGAEVEWYANAQRERPRNAPLADISELARVRGFETLSPFDSVLSTEPGRVSLATAPVTVLLAVPGFTRETAEQIVALRDAGTPISDVTSLLGRVSQLSAEAIFARYPDIVRLTTPNPDAWMLTVRAAVGAPPNAVVLTRRLVRSGKRCVVAQSRSMI